jgi:phage virion morphogenesis protein
MAGVSIRIDGDTEALAELKGIAARLDDATPMYDEIGGYLVVATQARFEAEKGPAGNPWPKSYRASAFGGKTLRDSGRLYQSFTHNPSKTGVAVGTNVLYAAIHQFGGTITAKTPKGLNWQYRTAGGNKPKWARKQSVTLPSRPFLGLDEDDEREIVAIAANYIAPEAGDAR